MLGLKSRFTLEKMKMSTDQSQPSETKKLTVEDPLDPDTLEKFKQLQTARLQLAERLLDLKEEEIRLLRLAGGVAQERTKLFETVLVSRGLPPNFPVEIDAVTGKFTLVQPLPESAPEQVPAGASKH